MSASESCPAVLVVEDESLVRMYAVDVLEDAGYEVVEAANAEQALIKLNARPDITVMFTDINMPGMDGFALAKEVHRLRPDVHLILTSGRVGPNRAELPAIRGFVAKPYTAEGLTGLLNKILS